MIAGDAIVGAGGWMGARGKPVLGMRGRKGGKNGGGNHGLGILIAWCPAG